MLLIIEVADTSLSYDRTRKARAYAATVHKPVRPARLFDVLVNCWSAQLRGRQPAGLSRSARGAVCPAKDQAVTPAVPSFPARVLLVEDNAVNQKVAQAMLQRLSCRTEVAANGKEAVAMADLAPYDLVFMDCQMPETDGFAATAEIRRREAGRRHLPIVAMTANAMIGDRERCLQAGMDDYLSKPVQKKDLAAMLARWVTAAQQATRGSYNNREKTVAQRASIVRSCFWL